MTSMIESGSPNRLANGSVATTVVSNKATPSTDIETLAKHHLAFVDRFDRAFCRHGLRPGNYSPGTYNTLPTDTRQFLTGRTVQASAPIHWVARLRLSAKPREMFSSNAILSWGKSPAKRLMSSTFSTQH